jgi:FkbM family methyltransferase
MRRSPRRLFNAVTGFDIVRWGGMHTDASGLAAGIQKFSIDCVVDVGANVGQFGAKVREIGYSGPIHSFEPVSSAFAELKGLQNGDRSWHVYKLAIGDKPGVAQINVSEATIFSSFLGLSQFAKSKWESSRVQKTEDVQVQTLDGMRELDSARSILLKSDTQGFDLHVINGAKDMLARVSLIYMEVSFRSVYEGSPGFEETLNFLGNLGYYPSAMYPVTRGDDFTLNEMDVLFSKRR